MKKLAALTSGITYLISAASALAQRTPTDQIQIQSPGVGYQSISDFLNAAIRLAFIIALVLVLVMLVWGAIEWIFSGGSKEQLDNARKRIINALVGLAILAVAFAIVALAGTFVGIDLLGNLIIPRPSNPTPQLPTR